MEDLMFLVELIFLNTVLQYEGKDNSGLYSATPTLASKIILLLMQFFTEKHKFKDKHGGWKDREAAQKRICPLKTKFSKLITTRMIQMMLPVMSSGSFVYHHMQNLAVAWPY